MPEGGGLVANASLTSSITLPRPRAPRSAVIMTICCWFSRSSSARVSRGTKRTSEATGTGAWRSGESTGIAPRRSGSNRTASGARTRTPMVRSAEPHRGVAAMLQRREEAKLGPGAAAGPRHFREPREDVVDDAELAVGLRQGRAARRPVIEDERALVHLRQKPGLRRPVGEVPRGEQHHGHGGHAPRMVEHRAERALVPAGQRIEGPAQAVEDAGRLPRYGPGVLGVPGGQIALAEERNQREREEQ